MATTSDDLMTQPLRELTAEYNEQRAQVKPPDGWRDDLQSPLKAVDKAMKTAMNVEGHLAELRVQVDRGIIHRDQAAVQRQRVIDTAQEQVAGFLESGRRVLGALPSRVTFQAWPDTVPEGIDWDTMAMEWESVPADEAMHTFTGMVSDALARGDTKTAKGLMSRRGKALLATRVGKGAADEAWPELRRDATVALAQSGSGADAEAAAAFAQLDDVERTFAMGSNIADMVLNEAVGSR